MSLYDMNKDILYYIYYNLQDGSTGEILGQLFASLVKTASERQLQNSYLYYQCKYDYYNHYIKDF